MQFQESITIKAPVGQVFNLWADVEKYHEWADPVIERTKLTEGPVRIGTKFKCVDQWPGRQMEFEMEITEFEQNQRLGAHWFDPMEGNWTSRVTETPSGTRLDFEMEVQLPWLMRLLTPIMKRYAKKQNMRFMQEFKDRVESGVTGDHN